MAFLKCGQLKKNHIPIIIGCIFSFLSRLLFLVKDTILFKHPLISNTSSAIIRIFTFIPLIILNIQKKSAKEKDNTKILLYNDNKKIFKEKITKILYIFLAAITFFVQGIIFAKCLDAKSNSWITEIAFICLFSYLILKFKPHNYHYLCIIIILISGISLDLINENIQYDILNHWLILLLKYIREIIYSFHETINKYSMERKFCSVYELCFYNGLINTILLLIFSVISYYYFPMDNINEYFSNFNTTELLVLLGHVSTHIGLYLSCLITNRDNSTCHIFIIYVFGNLSGYIMDIDNFSVSSILVIICLLIILFMALIFNEIIELNFCGLNKNTNKNIAKRAENEDSFSEVINDIINDNYETTNDGIELYLNEDDILVMCSDGILESSEEYTNKELWLKFLLEELETDDPQKIADIILQEAIDNNYGKAKDDMTVIVAKVKDMKK